MGVSFLARAVLVPVLVTAVLAACLPGADEPRAAVQPPPGVFPATVTRVVDGDTLVALRGGSELRVRLIGIDAPESVRPGSPVECFGRRSSEALRRLLPAGSEVRAAYQPGSRRDRYDRELWDVWLPDGTFLQQVLVRRGAAEAVAYPPHTAYASVLDAAEAHARARGRGLHAAC